MNYNNLRATRLRSSQLKSLLERGSCDTLHIQNSIRLAFKGVNGFELDAISQKLHVDWARVSLETRAAFFLLTVSQFHHAAEDRSPDMNPVGVISMSQDVCSNFCKWARTLGLALAPRPDQGNHCYVTPSPGPPKVDSRLIPFFESLGQEARLGVAFSLFMTGRAEFSVRHGTPLNTLMFQESSFDVTSHPMRSVSVDNRGRLTSDDYAYLAHVMETSGAIEEKPKHQLISAEEARNLSPLVDFNKQVRAAAASGFDQIVMPYPLSLSVQQAISARGFTLTSAGGSTIVSWSANNI